MGITLRITIKANKIIKNYMKTKIIKKNIKLIEVGKHIA